MAGRQDGLREEQEAVDLRYARLDALRQQTNARLAEIRRVGPSGSPQNRSERDAFSTLYEDRIAQLDAVEQRLTFGRLDLVDGTTRYVGRIGLTDAEHTSVLTDWRAPAAQAFYRATAAQPDDVVRRRHLVTRGRRVTGVEDEVLDLHALAGAGDGGDDALLRGLSGEGALLAALAAGRTGRMGDIVATIQAEQDAIIRSELAGALVVQGGPGTGKTAVALHRAAYLLYAHRRLLERSGVLLVGPSHTFLHYIDQVLPSLGETGVVTATIADLVPGVRVDGEDTERVAEIKGRALMAEVVARAVRQRQRIPAAATEVSVEGRTVVVRPHDVADAIARARRTGRPHNLARVAFVRDMLSRLAAQYVAQLGEVVDPEDRAEILEELRTTREIRIALNLAWMPLTPQRLVEDLLSKPARLAAAAPDLAAADREALARPAGRPWTPADVPLLDEAAELLGEDDQAARAQASEDARRRTEELEYARQVLSSTGAGQGMVSAELLADRFSHSGPVLTTAERAAADRSWTYGHVVVDEAQELSAMAWRMLLRRCPTRSMTIVGDVAQTASSAGTRRWAPMLDPVLRGSWRLAELTVNYRTPAAVADAAQAVAAAAGLPVGRLTSARDVPHALTVQPLADDDLLPALVTVVRAALDSLAPAREDAGSHSDARPCGADREQGGQPGGHEGDGRPGDGTLAADEGSAGRVAVIAAPHDVARVRAALLGSTAITTPARAAHSGDARRGVVPAGPTLDARLTVLTPRQSKGLEYDVVVLVNPATVGAESPGDLYVAMTRPTRRLHVLSSTALPPGLDAPPADSPAP